MAERDQQLSTGVPRLIDQYKQRRQAWLAQADELVRLRDEVRSAAEREALEIVTAARRDVRRVVVEARRELLVLTAQLHAAIESVDQASLQAAAETASGAEAHGQAVTDALTAQQSLGETQGLVMDARREVRSVLDEARAEIEALVAEANGPLHEIPAALAASSVGESPIPTLETILGADPLAARGSEQPETSAKVEPGPMSIDSLTREDDPIDGEPRDGYRGFDDGFSGSSAGPWHQPAEPRSVSSTHDPYAGRVSSNLALSEPALSVASPSHVTRGIEEAVSFIVAPPDSQRYVGRFSVDELAAEPFSDFEETGPVVAEPGRTYFADYDETPQSRPAWMWVGLFAATGIVAIVGTVWWFTLRDSGTALATSVEDTSGASPAAAVTPVASRPTPTASAPAAVGAGLAIEVRRTAWIRTVIDGKEESRVYQAGETRQIDGARAVSIRAGDGGAVFVSVNGRPAEALGTAGAAVTRQYALADAEPSPVPVVATSPASSTTAVEPLAAPSAPRPAEALPAAPVRSAEAARAGTPPPPIPAPLASAGSPATPAPAEAGAAAPPGGGRADLIAAGQQWLDAYQRRDRDAMSSSGTENMTISDERSVTERFPAWQAGVRRDLDQLELELSGDTALLTARMTERSADGVATSTQHVSRVSQIWVRRSGRWRLADVRIIGEARLNQIVR